MVRIYTDMDLRVSVKGSVWTYNPRCILPLHPTTDNVNTAQNGKLAHPTTDNVNTAQNGKLEQTAVTLAGTELRALKGFGVQRSKLSRGFGAAPQCSERTVITCH